MRKNGRNWRVEMKDVRRVKKIMKSVPTLEGAGVHLKRAFGYYQVPQLDPFLLLDDFHSKNPDHYIKGFPWHPHRGIETITYMLYGQVEHGDSLGNEGIIFSGDVQWMTAGSGIIHQEMPKGREDGSLWGFQLWANLPAAYKMMEPRYRDVKSDQIPEIKLDNGVKIRIICGKVKDVAGPVQNIVIDPEYLDVKIPPRTCFTHSIHRGYTVFVYILAGKGNFEPEREPDQKKIESKNKSLDGERESLLEPENLVLFDDGEELNISTGAEAVRFLLVSGKPLKEPVAWQGPIVMNTQEELNLAFTEYQNKTFLKHSTG